MICRACGHENRASARFCEGCGGALLLLCRSCGNELRAGARFCDACGAPAAGAAGETATLPAADARETRRTVSLVFCDVVGSTALQERLDPEATRRVMTRFYDTMRAVLVEHGGEVEKFIGDAVVASFGTRELREDDALRAVRAASAMAGALATLNVELEARWGIRLTTRTGVNTGEVVVGGDGVVVGDTTNTAARLEQAAGAGEILIGPATWRLVRHHVSLEEVAPLALKGKSEPLPAWRVVDARPPAPEAENPAEAPLVGREAQLAALARAFDEATAERGCRLATVVGSPGIGKTRLALGFADTRPEATVLLGRCEPESEGNTFLPLAEILRGLARLRETDDGDAVRAALGDLLPADDPDRDRVATRAAAILGVGTVGVPEETFWAVRRLLEEAARRRPLLIVLDDVHWAAPTFLDLIEHLAQWVRDAPILIVLLGRPELRELRPALVSARRAAVVIDLVPLDGSASRALLDGLLGSGNLPDVIAARLLNTGEGNPLFLAETLRMLIDDGVLQCRDGAWGTSGEAVDVDVPPTISALLSARINRLASAERAVVERASVIGKEFYRGAVAELVPPDVSVAVDDHLERLRRKELVEPEGVYWVDQPVFRFHHVLIRDAAYQSLLKEARAELHERFADWLERKAEALSAAGGLEPAGYDEVIAYHLEQAHSYRAELGPLDERGRQLGLRTATLLGQTGHRALARDDLPAACGLLARALPRLPEDGETGLRATILADLAEARLSGGDMPGAAAAVDELRAVAGDNPSRRALADVYATQLELLTERAAGSDDLECVTAAAEALAAAGDKAAEAKAHHVRAQTLALLGRVAEVETALDRSAAAARVAGDERRVRAVLSGAPRAALWGPTPVARASGRCLDVVRTLRLGQGARHVEAAALRCQAVLEAMRGRPDAGREIVGSAREILETLGLSLELAETAVYAGVVELLSGDALAAERELRTAHGAFHELGAEPSAGAAAALLARALVEQDRPDEAVTFTEEAERLADGDLRSAIGWRATRARGLARQGRHDEALVLAQRAVALAEPTDAVTDHADARLALAEVLQRAGRVPEARAEAAAAGKLYERKGHSIGMTRARVLTGQVPRATPRAGGAAAEDAGEEEEGLRARLQRLVDLTAAGGRDEALAGLDPAGVDWREGDRVRVVAHRGDVCLAEVTAGADPDHPDRAPERRNLLVSVGGDDRFTRLEVLGPEDDGPGLIRFGEHLGGPEGMVAAYFGRFLDTYNRHSWDELAALYRPDFLLTDRRPAGWGEVRGGETLAERLDGLRKLAPDVRVYLPRVLALDGPVILSQEIHRGHAVSGGELEIALLNLVEAREDGFVTADLYLMDDEDTALRAFEQMTSGTAPGGEPLPARAQRVVDAVAAGGPDEALGDLDPPAVDWSAGDRVRVLAQRGDLALWEVTAAGDPERPGGRPERRNLVVSGGGERFDRLEVFGAGDDGPALRRLGELVGGDEGNVLWYFGGFLDAYNRHAWKDVAAVYAPEFVLTDRRPAGWGEIHGGERVAEIVSGLAKLAPDVRVDLVEVLALDGPVLLAVEAHRGHDTNGGEVEIALANLVVGREDGFLTADLFPPDVDEAMAAFCRLAGATPAPAGAGVTGVLREWLRAFNEHDWPAAARCLHPEFVFVDRRAALAPGPLDAEGFVALGREIAEQVPDGRFTMEPASDGGDRTTGRAHFAGTPANRAGHVEFSYAYLVEVADGRLRRFELSDERADPP